MKIAINRRPKRDQAFGGGMHFVNAFHDVAEAHGHTIIHELCSDLDAILLVDPRPGDTGISALDVQQFRNDHPGVRVVHRINECDAKRDGIGEMDAALRFTSSLSDASVFVSNWMRDYHLASGWRCSERHVIVNGVDSSVFHPRFTSDGRLPAPRIGNDKTNIVTAHWSDNPMKGEATHEWLDRFVAANCDSFTYTFIGRTNARLPNSMQFAPMPPAQLGRFLRRFDVCVNASRFDPGPNSTIEAIASGLPTYVHIDGGGSLEFAGSDHAFSSHAELEALLLAGLPTCDYPQNSRVFDDWSTCIDRYLEVVTDGTG